MLYSVYELPAIQPAGDCGFAFRDHKPGAFIVVRECYYAECEEIARFPHDGTAPQRSRAYSQAQAARRGNVYDGTMTSQNIYEEVK